MKDETAPATLDDLVASLRAGGSGLSPECDCDDPEHEHNQPGHDHGDHDHGDHDHGGHDHGEHDHGEPGTATSVREATHNGHVIRIETTYRITIDGKPLVGHLEVLDNGSVHYHGLPNYSVPSAIDLMRLVIDHFGTEPPAEDELGGGHDHGGH